MPVTPALVAAGRTVEVLATGRGVLALRGALALRGVLAVRGVLAGGAAAGLLAAARAKLEDAWVGLARVGLARVGLATVGLATVGLATVGLATAKAPTPELPPQPAARTVSATNQGIFTFVRRDPWLARSIRTACAAAAWVGS